MSRQRARRNSRHRAGTAGGFAAARQPEQSETEPLQFVTIARILKPQGRRGEMLAEMHTDTLARFHSLKRVFLWKSPAPPQSIDLIGFWPHKGRVVLALDGIDSIAKAEAWTGAEVQIPFTERMSAPPARYFISELVGCSVFDGPRPIGIVADVEESPAGTLLHIRPLRGEEILVPLAEEYICEVNVAAKKLGLRLPEGLLDINSK